MKCRMLQAALLGVSVFIAGETVAQDDSPEARRLARLFEKVVPRALVEPGGQPVAEQPATAAPLSELIAPLLPSEKENKWLQIPWRTDVLAARREAARQGKPIFMWLMDGDPLGCT